ncbi:globin [Onthophagus taurus]|uniref:globin n=1 Tax=Onthophagus taurus TaxID=166361 RepID=UPI000C2080D2|nr:globin [Onthophagus taurus]XP_022916568.1 globin [Onthophagus taurus]
MGIILSYVRGGNNEPDPITGLTPREKSLVASSWGLVKKDISENGAELFIRFFTRKPEYQNYFPFRDVPLADLKDNPKLRAHSLSVMYAISSVIDSLDEGPILVNLLQKTGDNHGKRKIPLESFDELKIVMLELLQAKLGNKLSKEGLDAWDKTLTVAFKVVVDALKEAAK